MDAAINARSFKDTRSTSPYKPIDTQIFASIAGVLHEYVRTSVVNRHSYNDN